MAAWLAPLPLAMGQRPEFIECVRWKGAKQLSHLKKKQEETLRRKKRKKRLEKTFFLLEF